MTNKPLPDDRQEKNGERGSTESAPDSSLSDDIGAIIDDGKNYAEAEIAFQKSRLAYVASKSKRSILLTMLAFGFFNSALVALVIGSILTLAPIITPLGATAVIAGFLLLGAALFYRLARKRIGKIRTVFKERDS